MAQRDDYYPRIIANFRATYLKEYLVDSGDGQVERQYDILLHHLDGRERTIRAKESDLQSTRKFKRLLTTSADPSFTVYAGKWAHVRESLEVLSSYPIPRERMTLER